jgi:hypothetical protein
MDAEADFRSAASSADGQPSIQTISHRRPASSWHSTPVGTATHFAQTGRGQGHRPADARLPGGLRNVDEHAVADGIGAAVAVDQVSVLEPLPWKMDGRNGMPLPCSGAVLSGRPAPRPGIGPAS